jgi:hypothetical protein
MNTDRMFDSFAPRLEICRDARREFDVIIHPSA